MDFQLALPTGVRDLKLPMGTWTAGGGPEDEVQIPGFPAGLFTLRISPGHPTIESRVALVMSGLPLPAGVERLWTPGETIVLSRSVRMRRCERGECDGAKQRHGQTDTWPTRNPTLVCVLGDGLGRTWCLSNRELQLGRAYNAHVRLHAPTVSRQHATLVQHRSHWLLVPNHTKNPTRVNGKRIAGARELLDGDIIEVGAVALRFSRPTVATPTVSAPSRAAQTAVIDRAERKTPRKLMRAVLAAVQGALAW
jgi:hypothetical protein